MPQLPLIEALSCPAVLLAHAPPTMVTENYCFVIDGNFVSFKELMDEKRWKPTSSPVRYYYSEDLKTFQRVHIVLIRGKLISAILRTPRNDKRGFDHKTVPLSMVFRVSRHFSSWRTCSKFHKIVSKVSPVQETAPKTRTFSDSEPGPSTSEPPPEFNPASELPRRIFVQYLWRGAKESEKLRVSLEYDSAMRRVDSAASLPVPDRLGRRKTLSSLLTPPEYQRGSRGSLPRTPSSSRSPSYPHSPSSPHSPAPRSPSYPHTPASRSPSNPASIPPSPPPKPPSWAR